MDRIEKDALNNSIVVSVFFAVVTFLPSRCLATIGIHIQTHRPMDGFMKYAVEMGSGAIIYILSFIKIGSGIQKLIGGIHRYTDNTEIAYALFHFPKIRKIS
jgi:hypothetical protein